MAIIIPSKNIYEIDNPKVRNNLVDNVSVETKVVERVTKYDSTVHNEKLNVYYGTLQDYLEDNTTSKEDSNASYIIPTQLSGEIYNEQRKYSFLIPKLGTNKYIERLNIGKRPQSIEGEFNGWWGNKSITYEKKSQSTTIENVGTVTYKYGTNTSTGELMWLLDRFDLQSGIINTSLSNLLEQSTPSTVNSLYSEQVTFYYNSDTLIEYLIDTYPSSNTTQISLSEKIGDVYNTSTVGTITNNAILEYASDTAFGDDSENNTTFTIKENYDAFEINDVNISTRRTFTNIFAYAFIPRNSLPSNASVGSTRTFDCSIKATKTVYEATSITLEFQGVEVGVDLKDGSIKIQEGNKPYSLSGNELLQDSGKVGNANLAYYLGNNVLSQYAKGKETAVLRCDINDYKENGRLVISPKLDKKTFYIGDRVVPMVYDEDGNDKPMSRTQDGNAKEFVVVGRDVFFDGAVWQTLYLQEV